MKKLFFLIALMITSLGFAQQQQYELGFEPGTSSEYASNWYTFDNTPPPAVIITNPDPDGTNPSATTKVMKVVMGPEHAFYAGVNNAWQEMKFGTWKIDATVPSNLTVTMDINKNYVGTVGIKMGTNSGATTFQITDQNVGNTIVDQWQTLTWTIPSIPATLETNISQIVIFVHWTQGMADRAANSTILIDNIRFNAQKLTDAPAAPTCTDGIKNGDETGIDCGGTVCAPCPPSCTDGIKNQDETGIDCGGTYCSPCPAADPTVSAPVPTMPENEVFAIYSDTYSTNKVATFNLTDFTGSASAAELDIEANGNKTAKLTNLNYYGPSFSSINLTEEISAGVPKYNYIHLNYYATTSTEIKFYIIDGNLGACCGDAREPRYTIKLTGGDETLVQGVWKSVFIPLSYFKTYTGLSGLTWDGNPVTQLKFEGNGNLFYDNIYFSKSNTLGTSKFEASNIKMYPNPVKNTLNIEANATINKVSVYNILGQEVLNARPKSNTATLQTSSLQKGMYLITTEIDGNTSTSKFVKE